MMERRKGGGGGLSGVWDVFRVRSGKGVVT